MKLLLLLLLAISARASDLYLATSGPFGDGSAYSSPLDASSPVKFDAILAAHPEALTFHYAPGIYQTHGFHYNDVVTMYSGQYHIGAGEGKTIIQLVGAHEKTQDGAIFANFQNWGSGWGCSDMTLDVNATGNPKWSDPVNAGAMGAIGSWGADHVLIQRVEFKNFGTPVRGSECFPCFFFGPGGSAHVQDYITIDHCTWDSPVVGNKDGASLCVIGDNPAGGITCGPHNAVTSNTFSFCKSDFSFCHDICAPGNISNNYVVNSGEFYFLEPQFSQFAGIWVLIDYNNIQNPINFINILCHPAGSLSTSNFVIGPHNVVIYAPSTIPNPSN